MPAPTSDGDPKNHKNIESPEARKQITRRGLLAGAVGGAAATGAAWVATDVGSGAPASSGKGSSKPQIERSDVVVVGAGLAGLSAATAIRQAGYSVVVLEARSRVGGRNFDLSVSPGVVLEMGGEWTGPGQTRVQALAGQLGIKLFEAYAAGDNLYYRQGQLKKYSGDIPSAEPAALTQLEEIIVDLNQMAKGFPGNTPWTDPQSASYDMQSIGSWMASRNLNEEANFLTGVAIRGIYGEEADQVSLVDLLGEIWGVGGDFNTAIGSAQSTRFVGGPQQLSEGLARKLEESVKLNSPVFLIERGQPTTVHTTSSSHLADQVIVAVPKSVTAAMRFEPTLPPAYLQYFQRQPSGATVKIQAVYDTPFWRKEGLSGSVVSDTGPVEIVYDNSPQNGVPGVLVGFAEGDQGRSLFNLTESERRSIVLANLAMYFGSRAMEPTHYFDMVWANEQYSGGAYGSFNPPGVITSLGSDVSGPVDNIQFAGADYSPTWPGYMEGAIRSGESAAAHAVSLL
jgi:monoamine oxidase